MVPSWYQRKNESNFFPKKKTLARVGITHLWKSPPYVQEKFHAIRCPSTTLQKSA
jgi:hypothetical protein